MTTEDFERDCSTLTCRTCFSVGRLKIEHNPNNNARQVICPCGDRRPLGLVTNLRLTKNKAARRKEYLDGESLDEVWARFSDRCVVCSAPKDVLIKLGIGRQRQHVMEYAKHGHEGPLVPMCVPCHENATQRQKLFWFFARRVS
jgi:ribosomal protein S14